MRTHGFYIEAPKEIGRKTVAKRKAHRFSLAWLKGGSTDRFMLLTVILLTLYGSLMIFSASMAYAEIRFSDSYYLVRRQALWAALGVLSMLLFSRIPLEKIKKYTPHLYGITLFLLLLVPIFGSEAGGAKRWLSLGPFTFQPSELAKSALVLILAYYFSSPKIRTHFERSKTP